MTRHGSLLLVMWWLASPALAQQVTPPALSPEEEKELEKALASDAKDAARNPPPAAPAPTGGGGLQTLLPDISFIADVAFAWFSEDEPLQLGGHDPKANGFTLQQLEMAIGKSVDPYFRLDGSLVFLEEGVEIEEIYATTLALPANLQLRAGQFLTRFGRINATHLHSWDFVDQAAPVGRVFGGEGNRGLGVEVSWLTPLPWFVELVGSGINRTDGEPIEELTDFQLTLAVKQFFPLSDDLSLFVGVSAMTEPQKDVYGADLYLKYRPITRQSATEIALQAEIFYRRREVLEDRVSDLNAYAQTTWRFARRWSVGARWEWGDGTTDDPEIPEWTEARHRLTTAMTFFPTEFSRLRVQGSVDLAPWRDDPVWAFMTAFEFNVGVHGAHKF